MFVYLLNSLDLTTYMFNPFIVFFLKTLKKIKVLKYITVSIPIKFNKREITLLIQKGIGYPNLFIKDDFLSDLISIFLSQRQGYFIDVGMNIGQTLLKIKTVDEHRQYIGFEPNIVCVEYTRDLIRLNGYTNCEIRQYALSDENKIVKLSLNEATDASASIIESLRPNYFRDSVLIHCVPFDELGITEPIAILKIDVEGAELEVLMGMQKAIDTHRPLIVCEVLDCHSTGVLNATQKRADALCRLLQQHQYVLFQLKQHKERIHAFNRIDCITIKPWSLDSYNLNDYLFCHAAFEQETLILLNQLLAV